MKWLGVPPAMYAPPVYRFASCPTAAHVGLRSGNLLRARSGVVSSLEGKREVHRRFLR